ncbi:hypothetical protein ONS96_006801 [Cadophora gregata f. sp. sojae]|nr:hypothetical protein ONS96_006801 [Cadophora gregata f. sp. sojae]
MNCRRINSILLGLITITIVAGTNDFDSNFPTTFSFSETTSFVWLDFKDSNLLSLFVIGDTDQFEKLQLPCLFYPQHPTQKVATVVSNMYQVDPQSCRRYTDSIKNCLAWGNNGTATFGGDYAATLKAGRLYHIVINYELQSDSSQHSSESEVFRMINPLPVPTSSGKSISPTSSPTSSSTQSPNSRLTTLSVSRSLSSPPSTSRTIIPSSSSTTSRSTVASPSTPSTSAPTSTPASPSSSPSSTPHSGLTPGTKVGITVGVLASIIIIFFAAFFIRKKRQAKKKAQSEQQRDQPANRETGINLEDIYFSLGSPVTYDSVYEGRRGWRQRHLPPILIPGRTTGRVQSQQELHGSPF